MSIRLNGGFIQTDLTATFAINGSTTSLAAGMWIKKIGNFVDYDPFICIANAANSRASSVEVFNNNVAGATGQFQAADGGGSLGISGGLALSVGTWYYVGFVWNGQFDLRFYAGTTAGLTEYGTFSYAISTTMRYTTMGDLAQQGLVTKFNGEIAQPRVWNANRTAAQMLAEARSATPVDTADLVWGCAMASTSDNTDLSGHSITWASSGTVANGASDPPNASVNTPPVLYRPAQVFVIDDLIII